MLDKYFDLARTNVFQFGQVFAETVLRTRGLLEALSGSRAEMERAFQFLVVATSVSAVIMALVVRNGGGDIGSYVFLRVVSAVVGVAAFIVIHRALFALFRVPVGAARITVFACLFNGVSGVIAALGVLFMVGLTRFLWPADFELFSGMVNGCVMFRWDVGPDAMSPSETLAAHPVMSAHMVVFGLLWLVIIVLNLRFYGFCRGFSGRRTGAFVLAASLAFLGTILFSLTVSSALLLGLSANGALCGS